ncbi:M56 family metallopeptidase [Marinilabilia rubra]|uniref:TonB C-terminal domain-containing protein n=1 Tax=Marinilabilia rubra TaxID=2162893 RepID=A0A2U2BAG2_9BACT|nr:M56 family metallopeptidase [Marinilabilia rubra]PWE00054.1 hypothetical protein DDZ16_06750 [Marinilabilia rubra]
MISFSNWLYESSVLVAGIVLVFQVFLKGRTTFSFNRIFILGGLIIALILPFSPADWFLSGNESNKISMLMDPVTVTSNNIKALITSPFTNWDVVKLLYFSGVILLLFRLVYGLVKLGLLSKSAEFVHHGRFKLAFLPGDFSPFSFFNMIFIEKNTFSEEELKQIIAHETSHSRKWHSLDVILLESVIIFQWFNPFVWFLSRSLKEIHEFQADREVLKRGTPLINYKRLLLYQRTGERLDLVNSFHKSFIKKRFIMMTKNNNPSRRNIVLASTAVMIFFICFMSCNKANNEVNNLYQENVEISKSTSGTKVYNMADEMPEYPGGSQKLRSFLANNTQYPQKAIKNKYEGRVYVKFVISEKGEVKNAEIARSSGHIILDEEALRVVESLPAWTPGKFQGEKVSVNYTVPINFRISDSNAGENDKSEK